MEHLTLLFNAEMKPIALYKTNQTIFNCSAEGAYDWFKNHSKEYVFENWLDAIKFRNALRKINVCINI